MAIQPNQPQSIGGVLDTVFRLYMASIRPLMPLSLILVASSLPAAVYQLSWSSSLAASSEVGQAVATLSQVFTDPLYWTLASVGLIAQIWLFAAITLQVNAVGAGQALPLKVALGSAARRLGALSLASLVYGITVAATFLVVLGVILSVSWILFFLLVLLESKGPLAALKASHRLVWGDWWRASAILTVGLILLSVIYFPLGMVLGGISAAMGAGRLFQAQIVSMAVSLLITLLVVPMYPALLLGIYWDLKLRKEGGDLAARVEALSASA